MTTLKVIFRSSSTIGCEGTLYFRIIHKRKVRQIHTGHRILKSEWDSEKNEVKVSDDSGRKEYLVTVKNHLKENLQRLQLIIGTLDKSGKEYESDDIVNCYQSADTITGFISFARSVITEFKSMGKLSAAGHFSSALNSFIRFNGENEISLDGLDSKIILSYEQHLKSNGLCRNTTSYYMRKLRTIYNLAVDRGLTNQREPFKHVYTGVDRTVKRAVSIETIKALKDMDLTLDPLSAMARDMFLFSFYTRGMSVVDIAYLTGKNLQNGILYYYRRKTGQQLMIRWEKQMQEIVDRYRISDSEYLLPLIKTTGKDSHRQYLSAAHLINSKLKKLGEKLGLIESLTMYVARHAWASIARDNNIPLSVISNGMGHTSENTTRIYLASLDSNVLDRANHQLLSLLDN